MVHYNVTMPVDTGPERCYLPYDTLLLISWHTSTIEWLLAIMYGNNNNNIRSEIAI